MLNCQFIAYTVFNQPTSSIVFYRMFETSAEVRNMFEQFRTVDNVSDLRTSRALENHALLVMNALDEAITYLDDEAYLVEMLLETGKSHRRFENFGPHIFWVCFLYSHQALPECVAVFLFRSIFISRWF